MMNRAYATIRWKSVDAERRVLTGVATTGAVDLQDDIVEPKGAQFALPIPFLWQHDASAPVGHVTKASVTSSGIVVEVQLQRTDEPGLVKDRLDAAFHDISLGLVRGLSIGFAPLKSEPIPGSRGRRFTSYRWLELSAVTVAANSECSIQTIKRADAQFLPAPAPITRAPPVNAEPSIEELARIRDMHITAYHSIAKTPAARHSPEAVAHFKQYEAAEKAHDDAVSRKVNSLTHGGPSVDGGQSGRLSVPAIQPQRAASNNDPSLTKRAKAAPADCGYVNAAVLAAVEMMGGEHGKLLKRIAALEAKYGKDAA